MYSKRVIHKNVVDNNAYISAGDPYTGGVTDKSPWWDYVKHDSLKPIRCQVSRVPSLSQFITVFLRFVVSLMMSLSITYCYKCCIPLFHIMILFLIVSAHLRMVREATSIRRLTLLSAPAPRSLSTRPGQRMRGWIKVNGWIVWGNAFLCYISLLCVFFIE